MGLVGRLILSAILGGSSRQGNGLLWSLLPPKRLTALLLLLLLREATAGKGMEGPLLLALGRLWTSGLGSSPSVHGRVVSVNKQDLQ